MPIIRHIEEMLRLANGSGRSFPATILYNEGWLLRVVLSWFAQAKAADEAISFRPNARWFSEALLPSQFLAISRKDKLAEGWTHADGVIGQVAIGQSGFADVTLASDADQLVITEAKLFSPLSPRVTNASYFDQAARNVACLAEILFRAKRPAPALRSLGFVVLAPAGQINAGVFEREMQKESIRDKVSRRVAEYQDAAKQAWLREWFLPTLDCANVECVSWESLLDCVRSDDTAFAGELSAFYSGCLEFNRLQEREQS